MTTLNENVSPYFDGRVVRWEGDGMYIYMVTTKTWIKATSLEQVENKWTSFGKNFIAVINEEDLE